MNTRVVYVCCLSICFQAAGDDEISFDPEEIIEDIEQVDKGG
jgi:hypothetical protein